MSGNWTVKNLEEIFLSHEFAGAGASRVQLERSDGRSVLTPTFGQGHRRLPVHSLHPVDPDHQSSGAQGENEGPPHMNKPLATVLALAPRTTAGRQRAIAAIGGAAAAVLVVVGVTSGSPHAPGSAHSAQALAPAAHRGNPTLPPADVAAVTGRCVEECAGCAGRATDARHDGSGAMNTAARVHGSFSIFDGAATGGTSPSGASGLPSGGTSVAPSLPSLPSTSAPNPVTQLTSNVGGTLSTTTQQINAILPSAMPITGVVNNVASTVEWPHGNACGTQHLTARDEPAGMVRIR